MAPPRISDGLTDRPLIDAYRRCRQIHRQHGRSYFLATRLLPVHKRPHVHALYGFTRSADEIVDAVDRVRAIGAHAPELELRQRRLAEWAQALWAGLAGEPVHDGILPAVLHTIRTYRLDEADFDSFLRSMAMDLTVAEYQTYDDLLDYMEGSAAAIGTMMLPILGVLPGRDRMAARESARQLGFAFQLTNFIRDVAEDFGRGRIYLPEKDLHQFGVTVDILAADIVRGKASQTVRSLIEFECHRAREHYAAAIPGIALLEPRSRVCVRAAFLLYGEILGEVVRSGYDVLGRRATVSGRRKAALVGAALTRRGFAAYIARWHTD